jgi:hypothetical protein
MMNAAQSEPMEVVGSDGHHVGRLDDVLARDIELARPDPDGGLERRRLPFSCVAYIDDKVHLNISRDEAKAGWRESA